MASKKVLMLVVNSFRYDRRVEREAQALSEAGYEVHVLALLEPGQSERETRGAVHVRRVRMPIKYLAAEWRLRRANRVSPNLSSGSASPLSASTPSPNSGLLLWVRQWLSFFKNWWECHEFARSAVPYALSLKPDIVHAHDFNALKAGVLIAKKLKSPLIYDTHEFWTERNRPFGELRIEKSWETAKENRWVRSAQAVITVSSSIAQVLQSRWKKLVTVVRNVPDQPLSSPQLADRSQNPLRKKMQLKAQDTLLVYVGKITTGRGIEEVLQALAIGPRSRHLALIGPATESEQRFLSSQISERQLEKRVHWFGFMTPEQLLKALPGADLSVVAIQDVCLSYRYSLPNKLFESLVAGVPVVGCDLPEIKKVIEDFQCGVVFEMQELNSLQKALDQALSDPDVLAKYRQAALQAGKELNWGREKAKLIEVYRNLSVQT